jgi:hypothetical protein
MVDQYSEGIALFLWRIFLAKPFAALSIVICLVTIFSCLSLERKRPHRSSDRFLIGVLGLLAVWQGMRIFQVVGILPLPIGSTIDDAIELVITAFYLMAALMLRFSTVNQMDVESAIRLARAAPPRSSRQPETASKEAAAMDTLDWAIPRLSDGAFKLFALLCLRADISTGRIPMNAQDVRLQLGKSKEDLEVHLHELERAGAVTVQRDNGKVNIELVAHLRTSYAGVEDVARASASLAI